MTKTNREKKKREKEELSDFHVMEIFFVFVGFFFSFLFFDNSVKNRIVAPVELFDQEFIGGFSHDYYIRQGRGGKLTKKCWKIGKK